ncbi:MAG: MBL fold metallo-hydrolase [Gemmatimonadaceae bacterium]
MFAFVLLIAAVAASDPVIRAGADGSAVSRITPAVFRTDTLAPDVYVVSPTAPLGLGMDPNSLVVVGANEVLVVDAQFSASSTEAVIGAVRALTRKPVRWLVNTHWHDDHVSGNAAWRRAFPGISIVGHQLMRQGMLSDGATNRAAFLRSVPGTATYLRDLIAKGLGIDGKPTDRNELDAFAAYVTLMERFAAESLRTTPTPPDMVVADQMTIRVGTHRVDLGYLGRAHTSGDLVVHLPDEGIIAAGDLVVLPVPFVGSTSFPRDFGQTLDQLLALPHRVVVPGHGPVQRDDAYIARARDMMYAIRREVDSLRRAGDSLGVARRRVTLMPFRVAFAGADRLKNELFDNYVISSAIPKAWQDGAAADSAGRGAR